MEDDGYRSWEASGLEPYRHRRVWIGRDTNGRAPTLIDPTALPPQMNVAGLKWKPDDRTGHGVATRH